MSPMSTLRPGAFLLLVVTLLAAAAPWITPHDPTRAVVDSIGLPLPPHAAHPCGTDELGRDVCARLLYGARTTLLIAASATAMALLFGTCIGLVAGYFGGVVDALLMRGTDVVLAFPVLLLAIALAALTEPGLGSMLTVITLVSWTGIARAVRSEVLALRTRDFVTAALALGATTPAIVLRHLLRNVAATVVALGALTTSTTVLLEAALSYLGLGIPVPHPSWGRMVGDSQLYFTIAPWLMFFPGTAIVLTVVAFNFIGHGLMSDDNRRAR